MSSRILGIRNSTIFLVLVLGLLFLVFIGWCLLKLAPRVAGFIGSGG